MRTHDVRTTDPAARVAADIQLDVAAVTASDGGGGSGTISWSGTVSHGSVLTVSDSDSQFGVRVNTQPLYVNLGDGKAGSALGRDTSDKFTGDTVYQTAVKHGQLPGATYIDHNSSSSSIWDAIVVPDGNKPIISYVERYYDFNIGDAAYQGSLGFNLKPFRIWNDDSGINNLYYGYQGAESQNSCRYFVENVWGGGADYYIAPQVDFAWFGESIVVENSGIGTANGAFEHARANTILNDNLTPETRNSSNSGLLVKLNFDQVSNGAGQSSKTYLGYMIIDDDYKAVYLGNAAARADCTRLVPQPQTAWAAGQIQFQVVEADLAAADSYMYFRLTKDTWVSDTGVQLS